MTVQTLTIDLPESVYKQVQLQSWHSQRTVAEEVVATVINALPGNAKIPPDIDEELASLEYLSKEELWDAAQTQMPLEINGRKQLLVEKQQREGLMPSERAEAQSLSHYHDRVMLVRAKTAVLLKRRGEDIASLSPSHVQ